MNNKTFGDNSSINKRSLKRIMKEKSKSTGRFVKNINEENEWRPETKNECPYKIMKIDHKTYKYHIKHNPREISSPRGS